MNFTIGNLTFEGADEDARRQPAIAAVKAGAAFTVKGGQAEATGSILIEVKDDWFYCDRLTYKKE